MRLELLLGNDLLFDALLQRPVHKVKLAPHVLGALAQAQVDVAAHLLRVLALLHRPLDVLLRELEPRVGRRHAVQANLRSTQLAEVLSVM